MSGIQRSDSFVTLCKLRPGGVFAEGSGYPVFRFVKDVVVNNRKFSTSRRAWLSFQYERHRTCWRWKPKYHTYVVVIGESARRDAMGKAFGGHWITTPFASAVNVPCLPIILRPAARRRNRSA